MTTRLDNEQESTSYHTKPFRHGSKEVTGIFSKEQPTKPIAYLHSNLDADILVYELNQLTKAQL